MTSVIATKNTEMSAWHAGNADYGVGTTATMLVYFDFKNGFDRYNL